MSGTCSATSCCFGSSCLFFLGRIALATIFLISGVMKFMYPEATEAYMASKGMAMLPIPLAMYSSAVFEVLLSFLLIVGYWTRISALLLFLYLIPVSVIFHNFWDISDVADRTLQSYLFWKNVAVMGGLLYVLGAGAGKISLDACCCKKVKVETTTTA